MTDAIDRLAQLEALHTALGELEQALRGVQELAWAAPMYGEYRTAVGRLRGAGASAQAELNALAHAVPALFWLHKEWEPPCVQLPDGRCAEPEWFPALNELHARVQRLAFELRVIGVR